MNVPGEGCSSLQPPWVLALCMRSQMLPRSPSVVAPTAPLASCSPWLIVWSSWVPRAGWKHAGPMHVASRVFTCRRSLTEGRYRLPSSG